MNWFVRKWQKSLERQQKYKGPDTVKIDNEHLVFLKKPKEKKTKPDKE